ncbi:MAG: bifunctional demethylmenaquinone methyltransferase/2-methoxy-6-polyprenyl-1,4-benzoquinol methylase UbiE [Holophagales bacterium]|nr:bifunctional demethylmenaquinone methyltransferase/2-methoxy-6-polyprenyl-1,4-benzoquinol methylase UbiE [Holophagales bacterium]
MQEPEKNAVQAMFGRIARRYDTLNHVLSLGMDFYWWRRMAAAAGARPGAKILDMAAGTCDSTLALTGRGANVVAGDFAIPMLNIGKQKIEKKRRVGLVLGLIGADAANLPFKSGLFDAATICYGIRNIEVRPLAYSEFLRVLKPGGKLVVLEFSHPRRAWLRWLCGAYIGFLLPKIGRLLSGDSEAYAYLAESIKRFPTQQKLAQELEESGFSGVTWKNLCFGAVAIHVAHKPRRL